MTSSQWRVFQVVLDAIKAAIAPPITLAMLAKGCPWLMRCLANPERKKRKPQVSYPVRVLT